MGQREGNVAQWWVSIVDGMKAMEAMGVARRKKAMESESWSESEAMGCRDVWEKVEWKGNGEGEPDDTVWINL